ncbi:hypothetical protein C8J56DRAFT_902586 [Mycena floridula]|nr:hypothetical protein C8J56DRAFT_902586 [Mycena floridula]
MSGIFSGVDESLNMTFPLLVTGNKGDWQDGISEYRRLLSSMRTLHPHPIVFRAARRWFKSCDSLSLCKPENPMYEAWSSFQHYFQLILSARKEYKFLCSTPTQVNLLKPCGGCFSAHYCSRKCQKGAAPIIKDFVGWWSIKISTQSLRDPAWELKLRVARGRYPIVLISTPKITKIMSEYGQIWKRGNSVILDSTGHGRNVLPRPGLDINVIYIGHWKRNEMEKDLANETAWRWVTVEKYPAKQSHQDLQRNRGQRKMETNKNKVLNEASSEDHQMVQIPSPASEWPWLLVASTSDSAERLGYNA